MSDRQLRSATRSTTAERSTSGQPPDQNQSQTTTKTRTRSRSGSQPKGRCAYITRSATKKKNVHFASSSMRASKDQTKTTSAPAPVVLPVATATPIPASTPTKPLTRNKTALSDREALLDRLFVSHAHYLPAYTVLKSELENYQRIFKQTCRLTTAELLDYISTYETTIGYCTPTAALLRGMLFHESRSMKKLRLYFAGITLVSIAADVDTFRKLAKWEQITFADIESDLSEAGKSPFEDEFVQELERVRKKYE